MEQPAFHDLLPRASFYYFFIRQQLLLPIRLDLCAQVVVLMVPYTLTVFCYMLSKGTLIHEQVSKRITPGANMLNAPSLANGEGGTRETFVRVRQQPDFRKCRFLSVG